MMFFIAWNIKDPWGQGKTYNREFLLLLLILFTFLSQLSVVCKTKKHSKKKLQPKSNQLGLKLKIPFENMSPLLQRIQFLSKYPFILLLLWLIFNATEGRGTEKKWFNREGNVDKEAFLFTKINVKMVHESWSGSKSV